MTEEKIILPKELLEYDSEPVPVACKVLIYSYLKYKLEEYGSTRDSYGKKSTANSSHLSESTLPPHQILKCGRFRAKVTKSVRLNRTIKQYGKNKVTKCNRTA